MKEIKINEKWCKGCGICADFCPKKVFDHAHLGARPVPERVGECIGCGLCELRCPDFAITLVRE